MEVRCGKVIYKSQLGSPHLPVSPTRDLLLHLPPPTQPNTNVDLSVANSPTDYCCNCKTRCTYKQSVSCKQDRRARVCGSLCHLRERSCANSPTDLTMGSDMSPTICFSSDWIKISDTILFPEDHELLESGGWLNDKLLNAVWMC